MKRFMAKCIDNVLGLDMVYSDCSYNMACFQLECEGFNLESAVTKNIKGNNYDVLIGIMNNERIYLVYDENRGYLMLDTNKKYF